MSNGQEPRIADRELVQFDCIIRRATADDCAGVLECLEKAFTAYRRFYTAEAFADTVLTPATFMTRLEQMPIFVAIRGGTRIIGTIAWKSADGVEGHIRGLAVHPDFQERGIAGQLLGLVEDEMRAAKYQRATLDTTEVLKKAIRFYERHGYRRTGKTSEFFGNTVHEFAKDLTRQAN